MQMAKLQNHITHTKMKTIPFSIEEAKKPGVRVVTRENRREWKYKCTLAYGPLGHPHIFECDCDRTYAFVSDLGQMFGVTKCALVILCDTVLRPWKDISEVPLGNWFRHKGNKSWLRIAGINHPCKELHIGEEWFTLDYFFNNCEHTPDLGNTVLPCGVEE